MAGCGSTRTQGHGEVSVCGEDYYGEIYICEECWKAQYFRLLTAIGESLDALVTAEYMESWPQVSKALHELRLAYLGFQKVEKGKQ